MHGIHGWRKRALSQLCSSLGSAHFGSTPGTFSSLGIVTSRERCHFPLFCPHPASPQTQSLDPVPLWSQWGAGDPSVCSFSPQSVPLRASLHFSSLFLQVLQATEIPCNSRLEQLTRHILRGVRADSEGKCQSPSLSAHCALSWGWSVPRGGSSGRYPRITCSSLGPLFSPLFFPAGGNVLLPSGVCLGIFIERIWSFPLARHNPSCAGLLSSPAFPAPLPIPATPGVLLSLSPSIPTL